MATDFPPRATVVATVSPTEPLPRITTSYVSITHPFSGSISDRGGPRQPPPWRAPDQPECGALATRRGDEGPDDRAVREVGRHCQERRGATVVEEHEARRFQKRRGIRRALERPHPRVHGRQQEIHQRRTGEQCVDEAEEDRKSVV